MHTYIYILAELLLLIHALTSFHVNKSILQMHREGNSTYSCATIISPFFPKDSLSPPLSMLSTRIISILSKFLRINDNEHAICNVSQILPFHQNQEGCTKKKLTIFHGFNFLYPFHIICQNAMSESSRDCNIRYS